MKNVVIIGGGIIGCSTAYYISHDKERSTEVGRIVVIEAASKVAQGASGKSGGFIASNWHRDATESLGYFSFECHRQLADQYDGLRNWDSRPVTTYFANLSDEPGPTASSKVGDHRIHEHINGMHMPEDDWLSRDINFPEATRSGASSGVPDDLDFMLPERIRAWNEISSTESTTGVHPERFCSFIMGKAIQAGVELVHGKATALTISATGKVTGVTVEPTDASSACITLPADEVILAAGPWSGQTWSDLSQSVAEATKGQFTIPRIDVGGYSGNSIAIDLTPDEAASFNPVAVFSSVTLQGTTDAPEIFIRPREFYFCGLNSDLTVPPERVEMVVPEQDKVDRLKELLRFMCPGLQLARPVRTGLCFRPSSKDAIPLVGRLVSDTPNTVTGLLVGTGHTCWGISLGPGTGKCLSELVYGREPPCDISQLDPLR